MTYTVDEFAQKIKTKYPAYADMDNSELSQKIVTKHPEYANQVDFDNQPSEKTIQGEISTNPIADFGKGVVQGVSSLGVGLGENVANKIRPMIGKEPLTSTQLDNAYGFLDDKPKGIAGNVGKTVGEIAPYMLLPEATAFKGAGVMPTLGNMALTGAYQGGLGAGLSSVANKGFSKDTLKDTAIGAGTGVVLNTAIGGGLKYGLPKIASKFAPKIAEETAQAVDNIPTVGEAPIQQTSPTSFAIEADKTPLDIQQINNQGTSQFAQTVKGSGLATEDLKNNIGDTTYNAITNKGTLENAQKTIDKGQVEAINQVLTSDKPNANEIAMAQDLVRRLQQQGDVETAVKIVEDTSRKLTKAGQTIQAAKMWQQLTPDGALLSYQRAINDTIPEHVKPFIENAKQLTKQLQNAKTQQEAVQIVRENMRGLTPNAKTKIIRQIKQARETGTLDQDTLVNAIKSHYNIKTINQKDIDEINTLTSQIAQAQTDREKEVATALLTRKISEVKPVTLGRKLSTAQAMAQLLNPKTVIRNIAGNSMYGTLENGTQSLIASPIDNLVSKFTGEKTILPNDLKTQYKGFTDGAKQGIQDVNLGIDTAQNKYDLPSGRTFRGGIGEKLEKLMNYTLRVPDRAAYQAVYEEALQNQMKARGLSQPTEDIINQAKDEALKRTFQDDSALSKLFQQVKKGLNFNKDFGIGDFVLKYAKTPANILSRGLSYSPVGLAKGVGELTLPNINSSIPFNQRKAVMDISRGLVGTGIMGTGYGLAKSGLVTGQKNDNSRMNANLMAMGERPYAVRVGNKNYTYDWAVPASMPFSAGVNYNNGADFAGSLASSMDTLTEQPLLQGIKKATGGGYKSIPEGLVDVGADSLNSFYPSILRQTAQTIDPYYRETRDNNVFKQSLNRTISNTPFASQSLPKKYEVTGQPIKREGGIVQNFLNPANVSSVKNNKGLSEAIRLKKPYLSVGKKVDLGQDTKKLTPKEMADYQRLVGQANDKFINDFVYSDEYQYLSDDERADKIEKIQKDVNKGVKNRLFDTEPLLGKKQRTREQIIKSRLAKYNRVQNLIRKSNINEFVNEEE